MKGSKKLYPVFRHFYRSVYTSINAIYTVDKSDFLQVGKLVKGNSPIIRVLGNPRYDQVKEKADAFTVSHTQSVLDREKRIIAGSVHNEDEPIVLDSFVNILTKYEDVSLVWIPHDPNEKNISRAERFFNERRLSTACLEKENNPFTKGKSCHR